MLLALLVSWFHADIPLVSIGLNYIVITIFPVVIVCNSTSELVGRGYRLHWTMATGKRRSSPRTRASPGKGGSNSRKKSKLDDGDTVADHTETPVADVSNVNYIMFIAVNFTPSINGAVILTSRSRSILHR